MTVAHGKKVKGYSLPKHLMIPSKYMILKKGKKRGHMKVGHNCSHNFLDFQGQYV